jgi:hypothetical protein
VKIRTLLKCAVLYALAAATAVLLLSGCATAGPNFSNGCVGPSDFCQPYFGS